MLVSFSESARGDGPAPAIAEEEQRDDRATQNAPPKTT
jgi:hypothetical protein